MWIHIHHYCIGATTDIFHKYCAPILEKVIIVLIWPWGNGGSGILSDLPKGVKANGASSFTHDGSQWPSSIAPCFWDHMLRHCRVLPARNWYMVPSLDVWPDPIWTVPR
jgi:hypothetical protein